MTGRRASSQHMRAALSAPLAAILEAYTRYLAAERGLAAATVTAYTADVASLLDHLGRLAGGASPENLDGLTLAVLRSWLAKQRTTGSKRASMGRRAAAGKSFSAWAQRTGRLADDVGARLTSPRPDKTLPSVLRVDQAAAMLAPPAPAQAAPADPPDPVGLRDQAVLEL